MGRVFKIFFFVSFYCVCFSHFAMAAQPLAFGYKPSQTDEALLRTALGVDDVLGITYAAVDLNDDGMDEVVAVDSNCLNAKQMRCLYTVFGRGKRHMHVLLEVKAWGVSVSSNRRHGVYVLDVFKERNNAFKSTPYTWNASKSAYTEQEMDGRS